MKKKVEFTYHQRYLYISISSYFDLVRVVEKELKIKRVKREDSENSSLMSSIWNEKVDHMLITIIFSALSVEAFINDYAIRRFSKKYFEKYLDKLSIISKWIIIPRLANGTQLDPGSKAMEELDWLIKKRHRLVHYKTKMVDSGDVKLSHFLWPIEAERAVNTVISVVLALNEIDKRASAKWLPESEPYSLIKDM